MNQETKIQLLPFEIELMSNAELILTKNAILQKVKNYLEEVQINQQTFLKKNISRLPEEVFKVLPKISKGENYRGLPWLVLDYPRFFEKENVFAIRTMFWWGNFFSVTLHLSGRYKKMFQNKILKNIQQSDQTDLFLCVGNKEWEHHFDASNYQKINKIPESEFKKNIEQKSYMKIASKLPIDSILKMEKMLGKNYQILVSLCF